VGLVAFTGLAFLLWRRSVEFGIALLPVFCYELLAAISFIVRRPLRRATPGITPRLVAYAHSFLLGGLSAGLRLLSLDHLAAQAALTHLHPMVLRAAERARALAVPDDPEALQGFTPLAELLAMRHERGEARAFAT